MLTFKYRALKSPEKNEMKYYLSRYFEYIILYIIFVDINKKPFLFSFKLNNTHVQSWPYYYDVVKFVIGSKILKCLKKIK